MKIFIHNLKVALRNLMKYKLQTLISVVSIAVGIVTLALAHSILDKKRLPAIYDQPFYERTYNLTFKSLNDGEDAKINLNIIRALKRDGGLKSADKVVLPPLAKSAVRADFHLPDSSQRKGLIKAECIDPEYLSLVGFQSAITGKKISELKKGQAIIGEQLAKQIFNSKIPIGSIQMKTGPVQPIPVRIVDVYRQMPSFDEKEPEDALLFCLASNIEDQDLDLFYLIPWINVVLKEGYTERKLINEVNQRILPFGIRADVSRSLTEEDIKSHFAMSTLVYVISSLILLAAIIGFLRIHLQLFQLRRSELTLRIVNGAHRIELFRMLFTEPAITIFLAVVIAIILGYPLQEFLNNQDIIKNAMIIQVSNICLYSSVIGGGLLILTGLTAWCAIKRICYSQQNISSNLQQGRTNLFRFIMLGFQIVVSMIFVSCTLILINDGYKLLKLYNLPEKEDPFKESLLLRTDIFTSDRKPILDELNRLPELDRMFLFDIISSNYLIEIRNNPDIPEKFHGRKNFYLYLTNDPTLLSYMGIDVQWFPGDFDRNECILVGEDIYKGLQEANILSNNSLTLDRFGQDLNQTLTIGGVIKIFPYERKTELFLAINHNWESGTCQYALFPKTGKGKALESKAVEILKICDPENINIMYLLHNLRDFINYIPGNVEDIFAGSLFLGIVSLLICAISILSSISFDTRSRRKEVAIRKVNGAKNKDIYHMFGKVYIILTIFAILISVPVNVLFSRWVEGYVNGIITEISFSPVMPIILGCSIVILLIFLIVGLQIHRMMQVDPAKIIAKE